MIKKSRLFIAAAVYLLASYVTFAATADALNTAVKAESSIDASENVPNMGVHKKKLRKGRQQQHLSAASLSALSREVRELELQVVALRQWQRASGETTENGASWSRRYPHLFGSVMATSPVVGERSYSGNDLLTNLSSKNEDLALLELNQNIDNYVRDGGVGFSRPILAFSGGLETQAFSYSALNNEGNSNIYLASADVTTVARVNEWITTMLRLECDNYDFPAEAGARTIGPAVGIKRAYVVIGNLNKSPFYVSFGQMYIPFGEYSSWMVSGPLTESLAEMDERPLVIGFKKGGIYAAVYGFSGEVKEKGRAAINQVGANLGYKFSRSDWDFDVGVGYIRNIADSIGMKSTEYSYGDSGQGFSGFKSRPTIRKEVPAVNLYATVYYHKFTIVAEGIAASSFDCADATFNGHAAAPKAFDLEGAYEFDVGGKPSYISVGVSGTQESLIFNLPQRSYFIVVSTSLFEDTVQSIEFRRDINYGKSDTATSQYGNEFVKVGAGSRNQVICSFKVYF